MATSGQVLLATETETEPLFLGDCYPDPQFLGGRMNAWADVVTLSDRPTSIERAPPMGQAPEVPERRPGTPAV